eukprot:TRINITY_DN43429_c0_g1_i1.p1 TRINITY_DN43429_c0_g1~~TRINITY_DN43429_c0_g1_i1.p1  ORF type:complete len:818 (+),score=240.46 TRINITY_DN43429_c0_g1_i1:96-2549(+)
MTLNQHRVNRLHYDIEVMTRRLELEKRRLAKLEEDLAGGRRTQRMQVAKKALQARRPQSARPGSLGPPPPASSTVVTGVSESASSTARRPQSAAPTSRSQTRVLTARALEEVQGDSPRSQSAASGRHQGESMELSGQKGGMTQFPALMSDAESSIGGQPRGKPEAQLTMRTLLNKLDVHKKQLNSLKSGNLSLRREVDRLRRERKGCNDVFEKLKLEIKMKTSQLADFLDETANSRAVNSNVLQRLHVMKNQREVERNLFKGEVIRVRNQLKLHAQEKREMEVQLRRTDTGVQKKRGLIRPEEELRCSQTAMMRRIMKNAFLNCIQRRHIKQHQKSIQLFDTAFATIKQATGIEHIEEIVKIFVSLETNNYSLLTYVNNMAREIEALEGIQRERRKREQTKCKRAEESERERHEALCELEKHLRKTEGLIEEDKQAHSQRLEVLALMRPLLNKAIRRVDREMSQLRSAASLEGLCRPSNDLRQDNITQWLDWMEAALGKFRDLLPSGQAMAFPFTAETQVRRLYPKRLGGHAPPVPLVKAQESEEDDLLDRPMKPQEVRMRAELATERKRRQKAGKVGAAAAGDEVARLGRTTSMDKAAGSPQAADAAKEGGGSPAAETPLSGQPPAGPSEDAAAKTPDPLEGAAALVQLVDAAKAEEVSRTASAIADQETLRTLAGPGFGQGPNSRGVARRNNQGGVQAQAAMKKNVDVNDLRDVTDVDIDINFLSCYKMTKEELNIVADRIGVSLSHLCHLKYHFDQFDEAKTGSIDTRDLRPLLTKLGEDLDDEEIEAAFGELDSKATGEIDFFDFAEWLASKS